MSNDWHPFTGFGGPVFPGMISPSPTNNKGEAMKTPVSLTPTALNKLGEYTCNGTRMMKNVSSKMASKGTTNSKHTISRSDAHNCKKRYTCNQCQYSTDRRDLYRRHENIHRDEKPFHCYVCNKMFNRADHVKKHFLRIHKGLEYNVKLIKRTKGVDCSFSNDPDDISDPTTATSTTISPINGEAKDGDINNNLSNGRSMYHVKDSAISRDDNEVTLEVKHEMVGGLFDGQKEADTSDANIELNNSLESVVNNNENKTDNHSDNRVARLNNNRNERLHLEVAKSNGFHESLPSLLTTISLPSCENGQVTICSGHVKSHNTHHSYHNHNSYSNHYSPDLIHPRSGFYHPNLKRQSHLHCHNHTTSSTSPNMSYINDLELSPSLYKEYGSLPYASLIFNTHPDPKKTKWVHRLNPVRVEAMENLENSEARERCQVKEGCSSVGLDRNKEVREANRTNRNSNNFTVQCQNNIGKVCEPNNVNSHPFICELKEGEDNYENEEDELSVSEGEREEDIYSYASSLSTDSECSKYECEFCGCAFVDFSSLHTHRYLLHNYLNETEICYPYSCVLCGKRRPTQRLIIRHMERHVRPKVRYYRLICKKTCKVCDSNNNSCDKFRGESESPRNRRKQSRPRKVVKSPLKKIRRGEHSHRPLKIDLSSVRQSSLPSASQLVSKNSSLPAQETSTNIITSSSSEDEHDEDWVVDEMSETVNFEKSHNIEENGLKSSNGYTLECRLCHRPFFSRGQASQKSKTRSSYE